LHDQQPLLLCLDFGRDVLLLVPPLTFASGVVKGLSGLGEAIVVTTGWQLAFLGGMNEAQDLGLLAAVITVQQCSSTLSLGVANARSWRRYQRPGAVFAVSMLLLSPVGNYARESFPTYTIRTVLAFVFLSFALLKMLADSFKGICGPRGLTPVADKQKQRSMDSTVPNVDEVFQQESQCTSNADKNAVTDGSVCQVTEDRHCRPCFLECVWWLTHLADWHPKNPSVSNSTDTHEPTHPQDVLDNSPEMNSEPPQDIAEHTVTYPSWLSKALPAVGLVAGFLGGLCGINGPPFILLAAFSGLDKDITRNVFPMGQALEVWLVRLPVLLYLGRIRSVDFHLYGLGILASQVGLVLGNCLAPRISQRSFEHMLLLFLVFSSLAVLGLLQGHPYAVSSFILSAAVLTVRLLCLWHGKHRRQL